MRFIVVASRFYPPCSWEVFLKQTATKKLKHTAFLEVRIKRNRSKKTDKITIGKTYFPINQVGVLTSLTAKNPGDQKYPGCTS
jgi:hypothetical protein